MKDEIAASRAFSPQLAGRLSTDRAVSSAFEAGSIVTGYMKMRLSETASLIVVKNAPGGTF